METRPSHDRAEDVQHINTRRYSKSGVPQNKNPQCNATESQMSYRGTRVAMEEIRNHMDEHSAGGDTYLLSCWQDFHISGYYIDDLHSLFS